MLRRIDSFCLHIFVPPLKLALLKFNSNIKLKLNDLLMGPSRESSYLIYKFSYFHIARSAYCLIT
jgi:hypothetical protein